MIKQNVISKIEHIGYHPRLGDNQNIPKDLVLKYGYTTFTINPDTEWIKEMDFSFVPSIRMQDWYWHPIEQTFKIIAP